MIRSPQRLAASLLLLAACAPEAPAKAPTVAVDPTEIAPASDPPAPAPRVEIPVDPTEEQIAEAKREMKLGVEAMMQPDGADCALAIRHFRRAYELSGAINAMANVSVCAMKTNNYQEAVDALEILLTSKPDAPPEERAQWKRDLELARSKL